MKKSNLWDKFTTGIKKRILTFCTSSTLLSLRCVNREMTSLVKKKDIREKYLLSNIYEYEQVMFAEKGINIIYRCDEDQRPSDIDNDFLEYFFFPRKTSDPENLESVTFFCGIFVSRKTVDPLRLFGKSFTTREMIIALNKKNVFIARDNYKLSRVYIAPPVPLIHEPYNVKQSFYDDLDKSLPDIKRRAEEQRIAEEQVNEEVYTTYRTYVY